MSSIVPHLPHRSGQSLFVQAKFVQDAISNYVASADQCITTAHVPRERRSDEGGRIGVSHQEQMVRGATKLPEQEVFLTWKVKLHSGVTGQNPLFFVA